MSRKSLLLIGSLLILLVAVPIATTAYADRPYPGVVDTYSASFTRHVKYVRLCDQKALLMAMGRGGAFVRSYRALPEGFELLDTLYGGDCTLYLVQHPTFAAIAEDEYPPIENLQETITPPSHPSFWNRVYDGWLVWARKVYKP